jgi:hypothetical protein
MKPIEAIVAAIVIASQNLGRFQGDLRFIVDFHQMLWIISS